MKQNRFLKHLYSRSEKVEEMSNLNLEKLKEANPEIRLERHRLAFKNWVINNKANMPVKNPMKIKEFVMASLIVGLMAMNITNFAELNSTKQALAALQPDRLVIMPLLSGVSSGTLNTPYGDWSVNQNYDWTGAFYAVLSAGRPDYTWSIDDPTIMDLVTSPQGFLVKGIPKKAGRTVLRVRDSAGLEGSIDINIDAASQPIRSSEPQRINQPELIIDNFDDLRNAPLTPDRPSGMQTTVDPKPLDQGSPNEINPQKPIKPGQPEDPNRRTIVD